MSLSHPCTRTIASYLVHGLKRLLRCEAIRSPWSERKDDGRLARKSNSTNCYRENYEREVSQKDCLNIATVFPVNPVFNIYGIYGKYGIYGQTYQAPYSFNMVPLSAYLPSIPFTFLLPSEGEAGRGLYYKITMILLCHSRHFIIHYLNTKKDNPCK